MEIPICMAVIVIICYLLENVWLINWKLAMERKTFLWILLFGFSKCSYLTTEKSTKSKSEDFKMRARIPGF